MDARYYNGPPEDDDPHGEQAERDYSMGTCPDCGAAPDEPCVATCGCRYCRLRDARQPELVGAGGGVDGEA